MKEANDKKESMKPVSQAVVELDDEAVLRPRRLAQDEAHGQARRHGRPRRLSRPVSILSTHRFSRNRFGFTK